MLSYLVRLTKPSKTYEQKFAVTIQFQSEEEFADGYRHFKSLNLDSRYAKKTFTFFVPMTVDSAIGFVRLRQKFPLEFSQEASDIFNKHRETALKELERRNKENAFIAQMKRYCKGKIELKNCNAKKSLYSHQKFLWLLGTKIRKSAYYADPGTGKSAPSILVAEYLINKGLVEKVILVAPCNLMYKWAVGQNNELEKHSNLDGLVLDGDKKTRLAIIRQFLGDPKKQCLVTSYSFWSGRSEGRDNSNDPEFSLLCDNKIKKMFILDESHRIKNQKALCTKNILKWLPVCKRGIILSGTPQPQSMLDIFTQTKMLDPSIFGPDFYAFQKKYFKPDDHWGSKWSIKSSEHKKAVMQKAEQKALVYSTDDCIDLPKEINETVYIYENGDYLNELRRLSPEHIQQLLDSGSKGLGVLSKLLTACSGFTYETDALGNKVAREFKTNPKAEALETICDTIYEAGKKSIIWYYWTHDAVIIKRLLDKLGYKYIAIDRKDSKQERYDKAKLYDNSPNVPFLIASPRLISEGFDIYSPGYSVYYSYAFDFLPILQSKFRNRRMGSLEFHKSITYYWLCVKDSVEEDALKSMSSKQSIKDAMFGAAKNIIRKIRRFRGAKCK